MNKKVAIVHTSLVSHKDLNELFKKYAPEAEIVNIVDDSLLAEVVKNGCANWHTVNRLCKYFDAAASMGVDLIFNQCSSVGEAAEIASKTVEVPFLRVDDAMAEEAVRLGKRIGVVATVDSTVKPSCNIVKCKAAEAKKDAEVVSYLVSGAMEILMKEGPKRHNEYVLKEIQKCERECDVIVLAQGSMVAILPELDIIKKPVLTSPELGVKKAVKLLYNR